MTIAPESRQLLQMAPYARGKRSPVTCRLKCADACSHPAPNESANEYFKDVVSAALSRRAMLGSIAVATGAVVIGTEVVGAPSATAHGWGHGHDGGRGGLSFRPVASQAADVDALVVPEGFTWSPIIRWGDPILPGAEPFDVSSQSAAKQARAFGYNCDYLELLPLGRGRHVWSGKGRTGRRRGRDLGTSALMVSNHEYTNAGIMFDETYDAATRRAIERAAHGMSVVQVERRREGKPWEYEPRSRYNRRVHVGTKFTLDGPAAGSDLLKTVDDPTGTRVLGTLNNCAGGTTPWGTVLSGEENFHGYFRVDGTDPRDARYGLSSSTSPTSYGWELDEPRFSGHNEGYENESRRFGYMVEIDPYDPESTPVKHTAMGRFKHEGAEVILSRHGHAVAYMGDDERWEYVYKFVSSDRFRDGDSLGARRHNMGLLSRGSLYVAKFLGDSTGEIDGSGDLPSDGAFDGRGVWMPLLIDGRSAVAGMSAEEVAVFTRQAADAVGATKMDRPEDIQPNPVTGKIYLACTNNSERVPGAARGAVDEANPRDRRVVSGETQTGNRDGHVIEITEDGDHTGTTFRWNILLLCGNPEVNESVYFAGFPVDRVSPISCPDNVAFDSEGNLWISTDGASSPMGRCDGLFKVPLTGRERGHVQQFLSVPTGAETCGPIIDDEDGMVYVAVQHPGEDGSFAAQQSYFPDYLAPGEPAEAGAWRGPRPSVVQVWREGSRHR
ncbi:hypothetical protein APR04_004931 [Promicromonospora umidemergens]|uniref:PhoX family phosphatase n=1 Tax=Promicromonospora umidemergens TaxID=629679 RepID=A0ABP8WGD3_9MICO|nr:PhoX family phosphatase [Promicromonospora umidemergens]MCP2285995.1 hypothetical protein [Promicromonospora umidemergens]